MAKEFSRILRLFGISRVVRPDDSEFETLRTYFGNEHSGLRAAIVIDVERVADACGYPVPYPTTRCPRAEAPSVTPVRPWAPNVTAA